MNSSKTRPLVAIVGPTGSGKTSLALAAAKSFCGEIVNCDSLQLYRGFDIGTAKTPPAERQGIPHHLFDVLEPQQGYSAGEYSREARHIVAEVASKGHLPVIVGGTGFYLKALLEGLPALPERDPAIRGRLLSRERAKPGSLYRLLKRLEPSAADRIHSNDLQKLTRALEVRLLTRTNLPSRDQSEPLSGFTAIKIGISPDREALYARLDARTLAMFQNGLVEEIRAMLSRGLSGDEKPFESLGYKQAILHLRGRLTLDEAIIATQVATRQYAKRQWTWFRRDPDIFWINDFGDSPAAQVQALDYLNRKLPLLN